MGARASEAEGTGVTHLSVLLGIALTVGLSVGFNLNLWWLGVLSGVVVFGGLGVFTRFASMRGSWRRSRDGSSTDDPVWAAAQARILLDELCFARYGRIRDRLLLFCWAVLENLGYRQLTSYWRLRGMWKYGRGNTEWGATVRRGFGSR